MAWPLSYRAVGAADQDFLLRLFASTRAAELALTGWDEADCESFVRMQFNAQALHYQRQWPQAEHSIIQVLQEGTRHDVGRLWLDQNDGSLRVLDVALLPAWCGRGIGTACFSAVQERAARQGLAVIIHVEQGNPARALYDRLGFEAVGEMQGIHQQMRWQRETGAAALSPTEAMSEQT